MRYKISKKFLKINQTLFSDSSMDFLHIFVKHVSKFFIQSCIIDKMFFFKELKEITEIVKVDIGKNRDDARF